MTTAGDLKRDCIAHRNGDWYFIHRRDLLDYLIEQRGNVGPGQYLSFGFIDMIGLRAFREQLESFLLRAIQVQEGEEFELAEEITETETKLLLRRKR